MTGKRKCSSHSFTIQGYVAMMRKNYPNICCPFEEASDEDPELQLPPLRVPKFRWWRCEDCVLELVRGSAGDANDTEELQQEMEKVTTPGKTESAEASQRVREGIGENSEAEMKNAAESLLVMFGDNIESKCSQEVHRSQGNVVPETENACTDDEQRITGYETDRNDHIMPEAGNNSANDELRITGNRTTDQPLGGAVPCLDSAEGTSRSESKHGKAQEVCFQVDSASEKDKVENTQSNSPCETLETTPIVAYSEGGSASKGKGRRTPRRKRKICFAIDSSDSEPEHAIKKPVKTNRRNGKKREQIQGRETSTKGKSVLEKHGALTDPGVFGSSQHTAEIVEEKKLKNHQPDLCCLNTKEIVENEKQHRNGRKSKQIQRENGRSPLKMSRKISTKGKGVQERDGDVTNPGVSESSQSTADRPDILCQDTNEEVGNEGQHTNSTKTEQTQGENDRSCSKMPSEISTKGKSVLDKYGVLTDPGVFGSSQHTAEIVEQQQLQNHQPDICCLDTVENVENERKHRNGRKSEKIQRENDRSSLEMSGKISTKGKGALERDGAVTNPGISESSQHAAENVEQLKNHQPDMWCQDSKENVGDEGKHINGTKAEQIQGENDISCLKMPRKISTKGKSVLEKYDAVPNISILGLSQSAAENMEQRSKNHQPDTWCQDTKEYVGNERKHTNGKKCEQIQGENDRSSLRMPRGTSTKGKGILAAKYGAVTNPGILESSQCIAENVERQKLNRQLEMWYTKENAGDGVNKYYNLENGDKISVPQRKGIFIREPNVSNLDDQSLRRGLLLESTTIIRGSSPLHKKMDFSGEMNEVINADEGSEETESDDDTKMERMQLIAKNQYKRALTQKTEPSILRKIDTFKGICDLYGNQSPAWLSHGTNFQPNHARTHINAASKIGIGTGSPSIFVNSKVNISNSSANLNTLSASVPPRGMFWLDEGAKQVWTSTSGSTPFQQGNIHNFASHLNYTGGIGLETALDSHSLHNGKAIITGLNNWDPYANELIPTPQLFSLLDRTAPSTMGYNPNANNLTLQKPLNWEKAWLNNPLYQHRLCKEFPPGISNLGESSRLQPVTSLYAPMSFKPQQEQEKSRMLYAPSQVGGTKTLMISAHSSGVLYRTQGSSRVNKDNQ